uniref:Gustatory receptor n=1 Tax=Anopheles minimus TaxID=112268 RepID=A0A182WBG2_9DIPT
MLKVILHLIIPNAVLLWITITGQTGILLTVPSVHITVFFLRISFTVLTMNLNVLLNYFSGRKQMDLLNECHAYFRDTKFFNRTGTNASFRGARIALAIFLLHHTNYELNQYTYVILYDEKWPEFTFYVVYYFIEMITVMIALYYDAVLDVLRIGVRLDCALLSKCLDQTELKNDSGNFDDSYWWRTIEYFYNRMLAGHSRRSAYNRAFRLQLVTIALNTFIVSFSIFYVNMNSILVNAHEGWMEKYKRVTESLGFFSHLGAMLLVCHQATELECEQRCLVRLIVEAQSKLTKRASNMKRGDMINSRIMIIQHEIKISPYDLFEFDMEFFFGMIAAIVTYLVVLLQFRGLEPS